MYPSNILNLHYSISKIIFAHILHEYLILSAYVRKFKLLSIKIKFFLSIGNSFNQFLVYFIPEYQYNIIRPFSPLCRGPWTPWDTYRTFRGPKSLFYLKWFINVSFMFIFVCIKETLFWPLTWLFLAIFGHILKYFEYNAHKLRENERKLKSFQNLALIGKRGGRVGYSPPRAQDVRGVNIGGGNFFQLRNILKNWFLSVLSLARYQRLS